MTQLGRTTRLLPALALIMLIMSCDDFFVSESSVLSVSVFPVGLLLKAGASPADTFALSSFALTAGGTTVNDTANAKWTSSDTDVCTVDASGLVTATGTTGGVTCTIKATDGGKSGTAAILTYLGPAPTTLSVNANSNAVSPGARFAVTATATLNGVANTDVTKFVAWTSSNTTAATVDANGNVTVLASAVGGFTITATLTFGTAASPGTASGQTTFVIA